MLLYKYRDCAQRTWELLLNRKLYFATSDQMNDPLDSSINISAAYEEAKKIVHANDKHPDARTSFLIHLLGCTHKYKDPKSNQTIGLNEAMQRYISILGILSLSKTATDPLLWSHYANGHRGLCLGFDSVLLDEINGVFITDDVRYLAKPPYVDLFLEMTAQLGEFVRPWDNVPHSDERGDKFYTTQISRLMRTNLLVKSEKWKYEEEYRVITSRMGRYAFSPKALREVIRGIKMSPVDIETLNNILRDPDYRHVRIRDAINVEGSFEFGLSNPEVKMLS